MRPPFEWDAHSDQPKIIIDQSFKRRARLSATSDYLKMFALSGAVLPIAGLKCPFLRGNVAHEKDIFGIGLSLDKGYQQLELTDELGVSHILVRLPLWDTGRITEYAAFASEASKRGKSVLINVLQDREHIEDAKLFGAALTKIFSALGHFSLEFQIGNAINRIKWGFFSVSEYLNFFRTAQSIRDELFPNIELLGPSVIDFEYFYTVRALFGRQDICFDRLSCLLYVDRAGSPYARQLGVFDLAAKIKFLASIQSMSTKVKNKGIYITEVNWPIAGTAPYAPTSDKECVSIEKYSEHMRDYFKIAQESGFVSRVYWHQLIAPGYGLIDDRGGEIKKTGAFYIFKELVSDRLKG